MRLADFPALAVIALLGLPAAAACQEGEHDHAERAAAGEADPTSQPRPAGWAVRVDNAGHGAADDVMFTEMAPGWHVTTGPAAILYHPDSIATGSYRVQSEVFLFDPGERREGYGVFIGGTGLDGEEQRYTYFLLRRDGRFLVKVREGDETRVVRDWTDAPVIVSWAEHGDDDAVRNTLTVDVGADDVAFIVNGEELTRVPRSELPPTDGIFGLRVNHSLNLHVTSVGRP